MTLQDGLSVSALNGGVFGLESGTVIANSATLHTPIAAGPLGTLALGGSKTFTLAGGGAFAGTSFTRNNPAQSATLVIPAGATLSGDGAMLGLSVDVQGSVRVDGASLGRTLDATGSLLALSSSGVLDLAGDGSLVGTANLANNGGSVRKSSGAGVSRIMAEVRDTDGRWAVAGGNLQLDGGGFGAGTMTVNPGAGTLSLGGDGFDLVRLTAAAGSTLAFTGGASRFSGAYVSEGTTNFSGGLVTFNGSYSGALTSLAGGSATFNAAYTAGLTNISHADSVARFEGVGAHTTSGLSLSAGTLTGACVLPRSGVGLGAGGQLCSAARGSRCKKLQS